MNRFYGEERVTFVRAECSHARSRIPSARMGSLRRAFFDRRSSDSPTFRKDGWTRPAVRGPIWKGKNLLGE